MEHNKMGGRSLAYPSSIAIAFRTADNVLYETERTAEFARATRLQATNTQNKKCNCSRLTLSIQRSSTNSLQNDACWERASPTRDVCVTREDATPSSRYRLRVFRSLITGLPNSISTRRLSLKVKSIHHKTSLNKCGALSKSVQNKALDPRASISCSIATPPLPRSLKVNSRHHRTSPDTCGALSKHVQSKAPHPRSLGIKVGSTVSLVSPSGGPQARLVVLMRRDCASIRLAPLALDL